MATCASDGPKALVKVFLNTQFADHGVGPGPVEFAMLSWTPISLNPIRAIRARLARFSGDGRHRSASVSFRQPGGAPHPQAEHTFAGIAASSAPAFIARATVRRARRRRLLPVISGCPTLARVQIGNSL